MSFEKLQHPQLLKPSTEITAYAFSLRRCTAPSPAIPFKINNFRPPTNFPFKVGRYIVHFLRMGSDEGILRAEMKQKVLQGFRDFMTRVTKLEELGDAGIRLLADFQQGLEFIRRPPLSVTSKLLESIVKANETKRFKSYIEAGCINGYNSRESTIKLHTSLLGLEDNLKKAKNLINELKHLLEHLADVIQTANGCLSPSWNEKFGDDLCQQASIAQEESSSDLQGVEMIDYACLMGIIYSMVNQDYEMQQRIVTSLNLKLSSEELGNYCMMWSLHPFIDDEIMQHAWKLIR